MSLKQVRWVASDHQLHDLTRRDGLDSTRINEAPVAQDGDIVGDPWQFIQFVCDVNDAYALALQLVNEPEKDIDLLHGDCRRRLVHDEDSRVERNRLGNLHHLLLPNAQTGHKCRWRHG